MKTNYFKFTIIVISLILTVLYTGYLYTYGGDVLDWKSYVIPIPLITGFCLATTLLHKCSHQKNTYLFCCITFLLAIISFFGFSFLSESAIRNNFETFIVAIFPAMCYITLKRACGLSINPNILIAIYNTTVVALILLLQEVIFKESCFAADVIAEIYMYITAELTLITFLAKEGKNKINFKTLVFLVLINIAVAFLFMHQERIAEIIDSLNNGFSDTNIEGDLTNWLAYRGLMLKNSIYGNFSVINIHYMKAFILGCPVAWMSGTYGLHIGISIIVAETILIASMVAYAHKSKNTFLWIIASSFLLKGIIGFLAILFLTFSTSVGFPLVSSVYDLLILLLFVFNMAHPKSKSAI